MNRNSYKNEWTPIQDLDIRKKAELASILHFKEGYSVKEIADRFNLSESRIREYFKQNQEDKKGGKITIEGNPYGDGADGELGDFFIYRDGVEVVSWNRDELEEDEDVEDLAKEMFYLWKNDKEELGKRLDRISYAKGGKLNQGEKKDNIF